MDHKDLAILLGVLLGISEGLANIPAVKANSIFELITGILKSIAGKV